jgi:hypothetical protein
MLADMHASAKAMVDSYRDELLPAPDLAGINGDAQRRMDAPGADSLRPPLQHSPAARSTSPSVSTRARLVADPMRIGNSV